jgi:hypothetical protein
MGRIDPREERKKAFLKRHAASKEMDTPFRGLFRPGINASMWKCEKGTHEIDIIPYQAGRFDPAMSEGEWTYVLEVFVHNNVGPDGEQSIICMLKTFGKPCPICEHRHKLLEDGSDDELAEMLKTSRYPRSIYNIVCYDRKADEGKVQIFNTSHYLMEMPLLELAHSSPRAIAEGAPPIVDFTDPDEGKSISFSKDGDGRNTKFTAHRLNDRPKGFKIPAKILKQAIVLDEAISRPTYKEVYEFYWGTTIPEDLTDDGNPQKGRSRTKDDDDQPIRPKKESPRRQEKDEDDDYDPHRDTANDSYLNKDEDANKPKPKKGKCPNGGTFGKDYGELDECEDCDETLWKACYKASEPKDPEDEIEEGDENEEEEGDEDENEEGDEDENEEGEEEGDEDEEEEEGEEEGDEDEEDEQPARTRGKKEPLKRGRPKKAVKKLGRRR